MTPSNAKPWSSGSIAGGRPRKWPPNWGSVPSVSVPGGSASRRRPQGGKGAAARSAEPNNWRPKSPRLRRENLYLRQQRDILKKTLGILSEPPANAIERIDAMKTQQPIRTLCAALEVSPSGYYDWCQRQTQPGPRAQDNALLSELVIQLHQDSHKTYGSPRIQVRIAPKSVALMVATASPA